MSTLFDKSETKKDRKRADKKSGKKAGKDAGKDSSKASAGKKKSEDKKSKDKTKDKKSKSKKSGEHAGVTELGDAKQKPAKKAKYKTPPSPLKWHGGKAYDAQWIIDKMPPHLVYIEPFFGSGKVLFARDPDRDWFAGHPKAIERDNGELWARDSGCSEIANDVYGELMNFWDVLRDPKRFGQFERDVNLTPFSQVVFDRAATPSGSDIDRAVQFFVRNRMSRQGLGTSFATMVRNRTRRRMSDPLSAYLSAVEGLPAVHDRLSKVVIFSEDAKRLIEREDNDVTLFYLDPPYPKESRTAKDAYKHEMTDEQHHELLDVLLACKGKVILSTYPNAIYDERLKAWNYEDRIRDNKASQSKDKSADMKTERIWMNY